MDKFVLAQVNAHVARVARGLEKNEIPSPKFNAGYGNALVDLIPSRPWQINVKDILVYRPHEAGAI